MCLLSLDSNAVFVMRFDVSGMLLMTVIWLVRNNCVGFCAAVGRDQAGQLLIAPILDSAIDRQRGWAGS